MTEGHYTRSTSTPALIMGQALRAAMLWLEHAQMVAAQEELHGVVTTDAAAIEAAIDRAAEVEPTVLPPSTTPVSCEAEQVWYSWMSAYATISGTKPESAEGLLRAQFRDYQRLLRELLHAWRQECAAGRSAPPGEPLDRLIGLLVTGCGWDADEAHEHVHAIHRHTCRYHRTV